MQILTLSYEYPPLGGGGAKVAAGLAQNLVSRGHQVDVLTMGYGDLESVEQPDGVNVFRVSRSRRRADRSKTLEMLPHELSVLRAGKAMMQTKSYDIVHCHFIFPDGIIGQHLARRAGVPLITTIHGSDVPGYNPDRFQIQHKLLAPAWRYTVARTSLITSPSEHLLKLLRKSAPSANCTVIPNGFDVSRFVATRPRKNQIMVCTRMFKRKGVQYILEAVAKLNSGIPVHVVGDGPYLPELRRLSERLGTNTTFWGWVENDSEELRDLYETSKIFAFTSDQENFPINLLEAMCAGNAIITTDSSGTREVVGDAAILVPPQNPAAIASAIARLENEETAAEFSQKARRRVCEHFSWDVVTSQYEQAMLSLTEKDSSPYVCQS